jgi:transmembrane sensor
MTLTGESDDVALMRAQAEAAAWMALLHSPERNASIERGLQHWIAANPLHAAAWEAATDVWSETESLPRPIPRRSRSTYRKPPLRPLLAAAVIVLVSGAVFVQHYLTSGVATAVGEQRTLNLEDGTRVELNTESRILVEFDHATRKVTLQSGEAYFQVAHERRPFIVMAGNRKIVALGTAFTVRRDESSDDAITVTLLEGRVAVAPVNVEDKVALKSDAEVTVLSAGQRLRTRPNAEGTVDAPSIEKATGWMRGQLIFDHTPLREAAAEFSRYNRIKIKVASAEAAEIPIGGIFRIGDSRSFARAVAASYNLKVTVNGQELVLEPEQDASAQQGEPVTHP